MTLSPLPRVPSVRLRLRGLSGSCVLDRTRRERDACATRRSQETHTLSHVSGRGQPPARIHESYPRPTRARTGCDALTLGPRRTVCQGVSSGRSLTMLLLRPRHSFRLPEATADPMCLKLTLQAELVEE